MARRSKGREVALQMLYQADLNPEVTPASVHEQISEHLKDKGLTIFAWDLYTRVLAARPDLDRRIKLVTENWALTRMAPTDRNVLRLGAWELIYSDTPPRVVIDEAIELARKFGAAQSTQFVNGILDRLIPAEKRNQGGQNNATDRPASDSPPPPARASTHEERAATDQPALPLDSTRFNKVDDDAPPFSSNGSL